MRFLINFFQSSLDILSTIFAFRNNNEQTDQFFVRKTANLGLNRSTTKNTHHSSRRFLGNQLFSLMVAPFSSLSGNWRALATCSGPFRCSCCCWPLLAAGCSCQLATRTARISCWRPGARLPFTSVPGPVRPRHRPAAYPLDWRPGKCFKCKNSVFKRVIQYWNVRYRCIFMSIGRIFYKCICVQPIFVLMLMISRSSGFVSLSSFFFLSMRFQIQAFLLRWPVTTNKLNFRLLSLRLQLAFDHNCAEFKDPALWDESPNTSHCAFTWLEAC